jgi:hypothetical protein
MNAELDRLLGSLQRVKQVGDGEWTASCPAAGHGQGRGDVHPSLSINRGNGNGKGPLLYCHAGCDSDSILSGVGMKWPELLPPKESTRRKLVSAATSRIVATYDYMDDAGTLLYQAVRYDPKDFKQRRPDPDHPGKWIWNLKGVPRVLYRFSEVISAIREDQTVFVVEGEKDVDNLRKIGITATCNVGGAGKWKPEYSDVLRGVNVIVIPDNDKPGRDHASQVYDALYRIAKEVKIVPLPGKGKDVSDWIAAGGTRSELEDLVVNVTSPVVDEPVPLFTRSAADIEPRKIEWLWGGRLPLGKLTSIAGDPGLAKTTITLSIAAVVSSGGRWPAGGGRAAPGEVLIASYEDDHADTTIPRLMAMGADLSRIRFLEGVPDDDGRRGFDVNRDADRLERHLEQFPGTKMIVIDPISAAMPGTDSHKNSEVRAALHPLADLAQRRGVCILTVTHLNKGSGSALHRVTGSIAFTAAARVAYIVAKDDKDTTGERRLFLPIKNNVGDDRTGLSYTVEKMQITGGIDTVRIAWGAELVTTSADKALVRDEERGAGRDAEAFLRDILTGGPVAVPKIMDEAKKACIAEKTLRRAKEDLGVKASKTGMSGGWSWELPTGTAWGTL